MQNKNDEFHSFPDVAVHLLKSFFTASTREAFSIDGQEKARMPYKKVILIVFVLMHKKNYR